MEEIINKTNCVVLARVSSRAQEEEGYSLDAQEKFLRDYCEKKNLHIAKLFRITETASKAKERKTFTEMMTFINKNRIKILVVEKADRLTRSFKDMVMIDDWLEADENRHVHLVKDALVMNKHSRSQDKLNWGVKVLFAKNYTDNLREEVRKGRMEKLAQGWLPGKPPYGWITIGEKGHKTHEPIMEKIRLVEKLMETYCEPNHSLTSITAYAKKIGIRTVNGRAYSRSALTDNILKNPFYIGINRWEGVDYPGNQKKVISKELFDRVQTKMHRKSPPKYNKHNPDFKGMMFCKHCNGLMTWEFQSGKWYGYCKRYTKCSKMKGANQPKVEEQIFEQFEDMLCPSKEIADWVITSLKAKHQNDMYDYSASIDQLRQEHDRKKRQLDILYEDRLAERITLDRYNEMHNKITQEQEELENNIKSMAENSRSELKKGIEVMEKSQEAAKVYSGLLPEAKRKLLGDLFDNLYLDGPILEVKRNKYAEVISKRVQKHRQVVYEFRKNRKASDNSGDVGLNEALRTVWRAVAKDIWNYFSSAQDFEVAVQRA